MQRRTIGWWAVAAAIALIHTAAIAQSSRWGSEYFSDVTLTNQDGKQVRFYDDLLKGKIVAINLIYTSCQYACPLETARLAQVQRILGDRVGRDVFFYSISIDPDHDTPAVLKDYAAQYNAGPGWSFLTGRKADIDMLSRKLGLYSPPTASVDGHTPYLLIGNEATGQWMRNSAVDNAQILAKRIGDWLTSWQNGSKDVVSYANAPKLTLDHGRNSFNSHCAACHTLGRGEQLGPDLLGVTSRRDRKWLTRFIVEPNKMLAEGDPIARALDAKYPHVRMPNLSLGPEDAAMLIGYMENETRNVTQAPAPAPPAPAPAPVKPNATVVDVTPLIDPYLRVSRLLNRDSFEGMQLHAKALATQARKPGAATFEISNAADALEHARDLKAGRIAFATLTHAMLGAMKAAKQGLPAGVKLAYCPMLDKYWLQRGDEIQNPYYGKSMPTCGRLVAEIPAMK
jgi:protein SCO1/2